MGAVAVMASAAHVEERTAARIGTRVGERNDGARRSRRAARRVIVLGVPVFLAGIVLATLEMKEPGVASAVPIASGAVVLAAGALQFIGWKVRYLALCRQVPCSWRCSAVSRGWGSPGSGRAFLEDAAAAVRCGLRLGLHCSACSAGLTAILLVAGVMDLRAMAAVTVAVTIERLAPVGAGERFARAIGAAAVAAGLALVISAA